MKLDGTVLQQKGEVDILIQWSRSSQEFKLKLKKNCIWPTILTQLLKIHLHYFRRILWKPAMQIYSGLREERIVCRFW